jgi:hypothetical protein
LSSKVHGFYDLKIIKNDFVHHVDIQVKILKPSILINFKACNDMGIAMATIR